MEAARWRAIDCVVVRKFDRFARGASHLIRVLDELGHLGICFVSEQGQHRPRQPDGKAMSAIIGAMAELESSFTSERAEASMQTTEEEGKHVGCPPTPDETIQEIGRLAGETTLSVRKIKEIRDEEISWDVVGRFVKEVRSEEYPGPYVDILRGVESGRV